MPEFTTTVSEVLDGGVNLRGFSLEEIMRRRSYTDGAFLALIGRLPSAPERVVVNGVLLSLIHI